MRIFLLTKKVKKKEIRFNSSTLINKINKCYFLLTSTEKKKLSHLFRRLMTTDSSSSTSRTSVRLLIKYQKYILMYVFFFISHYCTAMSFERVVHPNPLGFTFFFLFLLFTSIIWRHWGGGQYLIFYERVNRKRFVFFFRVEREAFRWAKKGLFVCVCNVSFFQSNFVESFSMKWTKTPNKNNNTTQQQSFHYSFFLLLCCVWW